MSNNQEKRKRKRTKLECEVCRKTFDDDYRQQHNKKYHADMLRQGKYIGYKLEGAPANPFALAASARKSKQVIRLFQSMFIYKLFEAKFKLATIGFGSSLFRRSFHFLHSLIT